MKDKCPPAWNTWKPGRLEGCPWCGQKAALACSGTRAHLRCLWKGWALRPFLQPHPVSWPGALVCFLCFCCGTLLWNGQVTVLSGRVTVKSPMGQLSKVTKPFGERAREVLGSAYCSMSWGLGCWSFEHCCLKCLLTVVASCWLVGIICCCAPCKAWLHFEGLSLMNINYVSSVIPICHSPSCF